MDSGRVHHRMALYWWLLRRSFLKDLHCAGERQLGVLTRERGINNSEQSNREVL